MKVGFIGLGQMGRAMAERLLEAGHELVVYNRSAEAARGLADKGATVAGEASGALDTEVVVTMLSDDAAIEAVWIGGELVKRMTPSCVHPPRVRGGRTRLPCLTVVVRGVGV